MTNGDARRAEREAAYAKNPDQPIVRRALPAREDVDALAHHRPHMHAARRAKPIPMLLQKRRPAPAEVSAASAAREPEKV